MSLSTAQRASIALLVATGRLMQRLTEVYDRHGTTHDQYNVLRILRGVHPDGLPRYEIAGRLINRGTNVTRLLDRLVRDGLVERERPDADRRLSLARISAAGLALLAAMDPEVRAVNERFVRRLGAAGQRELARLCDALAAE